VSASPGCRSFDWSGIAWLSSQDEDVDDFALRRTSLRQQMEQYSDYDMSEERAIAKFLCSSPPKYLQLQIAIQTMLDISTLMIEKVRAVQGRR
jgi:hypothetical protein